MNRMRILPGVLKKCIALHKMSFRIVENDTNAIVQLHFVMCQITFLPLSILLNEHLPEGFDKERLNDMPYR